MIITQGNFGQNFLDSIPDFEKEMVNHGLDPEEFIIAKTDPFAGYQSWLRGGFNYTVTIKGRSFTVSMPNDVEFFKYFHGICFPSEENVEKHRGEHKLLAILERLEKWLEEDPLNE